MLDLTYELDKMELNKIFHHISHINSTMVHHISDAMNAGSERLVDFANRNLDAGLEGVSQYRPKDSIFNHWDTSQKITNDNGVLTKLIHNDSPHALATEWGTLHAEGGRIYPKHTDWLAFEYNGVFIQKMSVKGQPPKLYTTNALNQIESYLTDCYKTSYLSAWSKYYSGEQ